MRRPGASAPTDPARAGAELLRGRRAKTGTANPEPVSAGDRLCRPVRTPRLAGPHDHRAGDSLPGCGTRRLGAFALRPGERLRCGSWYGLLLLRLGPGELGYAE